MGRFSFSGPAFSIIKAAMMAAFFTLLKTLIWVALFLLAELGLGVAIKINVYAG